MVERRTFARRPLRLEVSHILGERAEARCVSLDLSSDGMRLARLDGETWGNPRHVWLSFRLPDDDGEAIRALGELRNEGEAERGFHFKYIYPSARRRLESFLAAS